MDLSVIRHRLANLEGRAYWRSLEEVADTPEFQAYLHREFSEQAAQWTDPVGRRQFLKLMGASLALAGVGACTKQPTETIVPYVKAPEEIVPGKPLFFATAMPLGGVAHPILAESHMGRPTKIEGNPDHPASSGATSHLTQASILDLYDPDRMQTPRFRGAVRPWSAFLGAMQSAVTAQKAQKGAGLPPVDRDGHLAVARRGDPGAARGDARGEVAPVRAGEPRPGAGRGAAGVRPSARRALPHRPGRRDPVARRRLPRRRPRSPAPRARVRGAGGGWRATRRR